MWLESRAVEWVILYCAHCYFSEVVFKCTFYILHFVNMSEPTHTGKKRKIEDENRQFKEEWMAKYFMQHFNGAAVCLICLINSSTVYYVIICVVFFSLSNMQADLRPSAHWTSANFALGLKRLCTPGLATPALWHWEWKSRKARSCSFWTDSYKFRKGQIMGPQRFQFAPKFPQNGILSAPKQPTMSQICTEVALHGRKRESCTKVALRNIAIFWGD